MCAGLAVVLRRKISLTPALCPKHRRLALWQNLAGGGLLATGIGLMVINTDLLWSLGLLCMVLVLLLAVYQVLTRPHLSKVTDEYSILKGFGRGFLDKLPEQ